MTHDVVHQTVAHSRGARHQLIADILERRSVRSQARLIQLLAEEGIHVAQATLSRDLADLGAVKARRGRALVYAMPGSGDDPPAAPNDALVQTRLRRACTRLLVSAVAVGNQVVVRTHPGAAQYLASSLDHTPGLDVLGTIAGDDTVLLVTPDVGVAARLADRLLDVGTPP